MFLFHKSFLSGRICTQLFGTKISTAIKIENQRERKRIYTQEHRIKHKKYIFKPKQTIDENYGADTCAVPDLRDEFFDIEKQNILNTLEENCEKRILIESETVSQAKSTEWMNIRRIMLTSSNFGVICRRKSKFPKLVSQLFKSNNMNATTAMKHGIIYEDVARERLEETLNIKVKKSGLHIDPNNNFLAASPDGLIDKDGLVEIKCPHSCWEEDIDSCIVNRKVKCFSYNKKTKEISINKNHQYYHQIQGQMNICGKSFCLFVIYTGTDIKITKVLVDRNFWEGSMLPKLKSFYFDHFLLELADSRIARGLLPR